MAKFAHQPVHAAFEALQNPWRVSPSLDQQCQRLIPAVSPGSASVTSTCQPRDSVQRWYIRSSMFAQSHDSGSRPRPR